MEGYALDDHSYQQQRYVPTGVCLLRYSVLASAHIAVTPRVKGRESAPVSVSKRVLSAAMDQRPDVDAVELLSSAVPNF